MLPERDEHLGSSPCKVLLTILKMDKGRSQINGPKDKEIDNYAQGLTFER